MQSPIIKQIWIFGIMSAVISVVLACFGFGVAEFYKIKHESIVKLNSQLDILAYNLQSTLLFDDKEAADKTLLSLQEDRSINKVKIYKADGKEFASFIRMDKKGNINLKKGILYNQKPLGYLEVEAVYLGMKDRYVTYILISLLIILISIPASYMISAPLRSQASQSVSQLVETTEALKRSNQDLEQFAYVASHDLQEPIRKIVGFSQLFAKEFEGKMDKNAEEYMTYIVDGGKRMQILIQDLLQFSRVSSGKLTLEMSDFNDIVQEALQNLETVIADNKAEIHVTELPTLAVHRVQIVQLFQNLIGNAIKYRSEKIPVVDISVQKQDGHWVFIIKDNGIGISEEFYEKIFVIFQRLHGRSSKYSGTGIGLAICKRTVERHGGRIWVESTLGQGTSFKFTLSERN